MVVVLFCAYFSWLGLQNILAPWLYHSGLLSLQQTYVLMATKDALLFIGILVLGYRCFQREFEWNWLDRFACGYVAALTIYLFVPDWLHLDVPFAVRLITFRSQIGLVAFFFWGRLCRFTWAEWRSLALFQIIMQTAAAIFGVFEKFFLPLTFWSQTIGVGDYLLDVKQLDDYLNVQDGLPSNLIHFGTRRLLSIYADPLGMGIATVFPLVAAVAVALCLRRSDEQNEQKKAWIFLVGAAWMGLALLLTIARESIGAAMLALVVLCLLLREYRVLAWSCGTALTLFLVIPPLRSSILSTVTFQEDSAATHLSLLSQGIQEISTLLIGRGVGTTGAWATSLGVRGLTSVGESSYLELAAQAGVVTLALFLGFLVGLTVWLWKTSLRSDDAVWRAIFLSLSVTLGARLVVAVFSPSFFALIPMANLFFLAGAAMTTTIRLPHETDSTVLELLPEDCTMHA